MNKMKRISAIFLTAIFILTSLAGCGNDTATDGTTDPVLKTGAVSYLGPEGTYTHEATKLFFGSDGDYRPQKDVSAAVDRLIEGECVYAVIPQENTIGGPVYDYLDELLSHENISIAGEIELPVRQALLCREGTKPEDIKVVYSHQQGIIQSMAWLEENLPDAQVVEVSSTAQGAVMVAESDGYDCAAIASSAAADVYGLTVFANSIQQNEDNKTRFYVLSTDAPGKEISDRMLFSVTGSADDVVDVIGNISEEGFEVISLHDRPEKTVLGNYVYLIECENASYEDYEKFIRDTDAEFYYYGTFPVM